MKDYRIFNLRSKDLNIDGTPKLPSEDRLEYGEIAINYNEGHEIIIIKNSKNELVTFDTTNNDNLINMDRRFKSKGTFFTSDEAHKAIPLALRKIGIIIFYKISDNKIIFEQYVGTNLDDWTIMSNWKPVNGIIDNLESTSIDDSLSANQGRILNNKFIFLDHTLLPLLIETKAYPEGLSERGVPIDVSYSWSISRNGYDDSQVPMLEVYINGIKQSSPNNKITYKNISDVKKITVKVVSVEGLNIQEEITKDFTESIFAGLIDETEQLTPENIIKYKQYKIVNKQTVVFLTKNKEYDKSLGMVNNKVAFYAYPKDRGELTKILDGNNFDISELYKKGKNWNVTILRMTVDKKPIDYYVYKSEKFDTKKSVTHKYR